MKIFVPEPAQDDHGYGEGHERGAVAHRVQSLHRHVVHVLKVTSNRFKQLNLLKQGREPPAGTDHVAAVPVLVQTGVDVMREGLRPAVLGAVTAHGSQLCGQETLSQNMRHTRVDGERPRLLSRHNNPHRFSNLSLPFLVFSLYSFY